MNPILLRVTLDPGWEKQLRTLRKSSVNVATAKALTFTAKDAQIALKLEAPSLFVLRRNWVPGGIRIRPANGSKLQSTVGSIDKYMERHVIGAGKKKHAAKSLSIRSKRGSNGRLSSGGILIAPYGSIGSAPVHTVVRRRLKRMNGNKRKPFEIVGKGGGKVFIVRRASTKRKPLQILAVLQEGATIYENWDFFGTVKGVVSAKFPRHFFRAVLSASKR